MGDSFYRLQHNPKIKNKPKHKMYEVNPNNPEGNVSMLEACAIIAPECLPQDYSDPFGEEGNLELRAEDPFYSVEEEAPSYSFPEEDERIVLLESVYVNGRA